MADASIITLRNVNFYYGQVKALTDINMDFAQNNVTALIGPSGCGKSTLLRLLNRMNDLIDGTRVEGEILFEGNNIYSAGVDPVEIRKKIGMVFQKPNPFPKTIYNNITYGPKLMWSSNKNDLDDLVEQSLKQAVLWDEVKDILHKSAMTLSGGQQQRLCIARALAMKPDVLLMDEPTSALDPISAKLVETQFRILKKDYTIILVTHILRQARRLGDYIVFLYMGDLVEHEPAAQFFRSPRDEKTRAYINGEIS